VRILLVDDVADNRELVLLYLKGQPVSVVEAADGREAVERFAVGGFDAVILDMMLPVLDGVAVMAGFREIEAARGWPAVPVLAVSAGAFPEDEARSLAAGCNRYLAKPVSRARLLSVLAEVLGSPQAGAPAGSEPGPPIAGGGAAGEDDSTVTVAAELAPLIPRLMQSLAELSAQALDAAAAGRAEEVRRHGHAIKGAALWYGFAALSKLGAIMERQAAAGNLAAASAAARDILVLLPRLRIVYRDG
jgi:CheY-like chemotaxis protein/HPt (histidine-containing phosphotransfer) domain-containing protein